MARKFNAQKTRAALKQRETSVRAVSKRMQENDPGVFSDFEYARSAFNRWLAGKNEPSKTSLERLAAAIPCEIEEITDAEEEDEELIERMNGIQFKWQGEDAA